MKARARGGCGGGCGGALAVLSDYCANASFHGLRFIADRRRHWTERLFWLACCLLSWYGSWLLIQASWVAFQNNAISFAMETNYLTWDTEFPAVVLCEKDSDRRIMKHRPLYGAEKTGKRNYNLDEVFKEMTYFNFLSPFTKSRCFDAELRFLGDSHCPYTDLHLFYLQFRTPCAEMFASCVWNERPFPCCDQFRPMETEMGVCYAFNSIHTNQSGQMSATSNRATGPGSLRAEVRVASTVYVIARQEVPTRNSNDLTRFLLELGSFVRHWYTVKDVENDAELRHTSLAQRGCRLAEEGLPVYALYSYSGCVAQCRADAQRRLCGCVNHLTPRAAAADMCNLTGVLCLNARRLDLTVIKQSNSNKAGLHCHCASSCDDQEIRKTYSFNERMPVDNATGMVEVNMDRLPTVRFRRNVVRAKLDLVVSMGGTCGLLVGASLLSFVELLYFFTLRACGTAAAARQKQQQEEQGEQKKEQKEQQQQLQRKKMAGRAAPPPGAAEHL